MIAAAPAVEHRAAAPVAVGMLSNYVSVLARERVSYLRLDASFDVGKPAMCPRDEPFSPDDTAASTMWWGAYCAEYRDQSAELYVQVLHKGKLVYEDDANGYDGRWSGRVYLWELRTKPSCSAGSYKWTVVLRDPYARRGSAKSDTGWFTVRCP